MPADSPQLEHALLLMDQGRYDLATERLRAAIAEDPEDGDRYALLATCLLNQDRIKEAETAARRSVELQADDAHNLATLSLILSRRNKSGEALAVAKRAVEQAPGSEYAWCAVAVAHSSANRWADALEAAERGLAIDPDDGNLRGLRSNALTKLGRSVAVDEARSALADDPDGDLAHANLGFALLGAGKQEEAVSHFREALRIDPNYTGAREGLLDAMKARSWVYRPILAVYARAQRFTVMQQLAIIAGLFGFLYLFKKAGAFVPALTPYYHIVNGVVVAATLCIGFGDALVSLIMRFDPIGRYALTARQSRFALAIGILTVPLVVTLIGTALSANPLWTRAMFIVFPYLGALIVLMDVTQPAQVKAATGLLAGCAAVGLALAVDRLLYPIGLVVLVKPYMYASLFGALAIWAWQTFGESET